MTCPRTVEGAGYLWLKFRALQKSLGRGGCPGGSINGVGGWERDGTFTSESLEKGRGRSFPCDQRS